MINRVARRKDRYQEFSIYVVPHLVAINNLLILICPLFVITIPAADSAISIYFLLSLLIS